MMSRRILTILLALATLASLLGPVVEARDRDPLAPVLGMEAPPFEAFPPEIIAQENAEAITSLVNEARLFGVPIAVRVVSRAEGHPNLPQLEDLDPSEPVPDEVMREMARSWMERESIESAPGAEDGFLMLVIIPEDHTRSTAVIEPGPHALPLNGLTRANIDEVVQTQVLPLFADNRVSQGIRSGLSVFSYNNLFGRPERIQPDDLHEDLQLVAGVPMAGITVAGSLALAGLALWVHRRERDTTPDGMEPLSLSPFGAAALHEGRVNDAVVTGGLLELIRRGVVRPEGETLRIDERRSAMVDDPFLAGIVRVLRHNAGADGVVAPAVFRRLHDLTGPVRRGLEDSLAHQGLFNRDGKAELMWLLLGGGAVISLGLFTLIPSILGMAWLGIIAIIIAVATVTAVVVWATRRSWTTDRGRQALAAWQERATVDDRIAFDTIVHQDDLMSAIGGPLTPPTVNLVRSLRGIGAT